MSDENERNSPAGTKAAGASETVIVTVEVQRHGRPVETIEVECDVAAATPQLPQKLAELLALEVGELVEELAGSDRAQDHGGHRHKLKLECIDVHFETESAVHHFPARTKWSRVHRWACSRFRIAADIAANLELRDGSPEGVALNESGQIGEFSGCRSVWLVKPGPEANGR